MDIQVHVYYQSNPMNNQDIILLDYFSLANILGPEATTESWKPMFTFKGKIASQNILKLYYFITNTLMEFHISWSTSAVFKISLQILWAQGIVTIITTLRWSSCDPVPGPQDTQCRVAIIVTTQGNELLIGPIFCHLSLFFTFTSMYHVMVSLMGWVTILFFI